MKKLTLVALIAAVLVSAGCRKKKTVIIERDDYNNEYYDDYGRPMHDRSTTVRKDGKTVKYVQKTPNNRQQNRTHVEID